MEFLFICIVASILLITSKLDRICITVFILITLFHEIFLSNLGGFWYYITAANCDLLIICILGQLSFRTRLSVNLQYLSVLSIILNLNGWLDWYSYKPPGVYNTSYLLYYLVVLLTIIYGRHMGTTKVDSLNFSIYGNNCSSNSINNTF